MKCCENKNILKEKEMFVCTNCASNTWIYMDRI